MARYEKKWTSKEVSQLCYNKGYCLCIFCFILCNTASMQDYAFTKHRIFQWLGIILAVAIIAVGYWYWRADAGMKTNVTATGSLTSGLVGYWTFDGVDTSSTTATDRGSEGNNGTLTGGPTVIPGKLGQSLSFDGSNDRVSMANDTSYNASNITTAAWIKTSTTGVYQSILQYDTFGVARTFQFRLETSNVAKLILFVGSGNVVEVASTTILTDGQWHFVLATYDGANMKMYVDGRLESTVAETRTLDSGGASLNMHIGAYEGTPAAYSTFFTGSIDDVRYYSRALSATEIQSLYALGASDPVNSSASQPQGTGRLDSGLAGYWAMDDGSGTNANDNSTNNNDGTLTNGPTWTTGQIGSAVDFDGTDDVITTSRVIPTRGSISVWVNTDSSLSPSDHYTVVDNTDVSGNLFFLELNTFDTYNAWEFSYRGAFGNTIDLQAPAYTSDSQIQGWRLLTGTWDSATGGSLYVDGVLVASTATTTGTMSSSMTLSMGDDDGGTRGEWNGRMDEVRLYDRVLSADEVANLYRLTTPTGADTSLKGYWSFNGKDMNGTTAYDRSGAGNTGTLTNGPTVTPGKVGQALSFDGSNDYIAVSSSSALNPTTAITLSAWVKRSTTGVRQFILSKGDFGFASTTQYWIEFTSADLVTFGFHNSTNAYTISSPSAITDSNWHHIVATYDSTTRRLYIDGVQVNSAALALSINSNSGEFTIGTSATSHGSPYSGSIDEVRVYNTALSAAQIKAFYDQGTSDEQNTGVSQPQGTGRLDSGLAGYWALDDGTSGATPTSATDSSTNGNTGTLTNGPTWTTGQIGNAVQFDNSNDSIQVADAANLSFTNGSGADLPYSVSAWVYMNDITETAGIVGKWIQASSRMEWVLRSAGSIISFQNYHSNSTSNVIGRTAPISTGSHQGRWIQVTGTYDGSESSSGMAIYINGVRADTADSGAGTYTGMSNTTAPVEIGAYNSGTNILNGSIDEVRIYNRALSADEVANLYRLTTPTGTETGLKAYLSFNGKDMSGTSAYDRSGAGNTGTTSGSPSVTPGKVGQGLAFDGSDDYVSIADVSSIDYDYTQDFSFALWVKLPSTQADTSGGDNFIVEKWSGSTGYPYTLRVYNQTYGTSGDRGKVVFRRYDGTNSPGVTSTSLLNDNNWHHVVGTKSGSQLRLYVDGASQATATDTTTTTTTNTSPLYIGTRGGSTNNLTGSVDELRIYNRTLSASEVAALYNNR